MTEYEIKKPSFHRCDKPSELPLVSILTVVFNGEDHLEETILSVISQDYVNFEYVIIDGGSSDGTLDIINRYRSSIDYFISEPDDGIYDAINKGIKQCKGDIIKIQNADDLLSPSAIRLVVEAFKRIDQSMPTILIGKCGVIDKNSKLVGEIGRTPLFWRTIPLSHPSWFVSASVYEVCGLYSTEYKIAADYEFYLRALRNNINVAYLDENVAMFRKGGASSGFKGVFERANINFQYRSFIVAIVVFIQHLFGKIAASIYRSIRKN